MFASFDSSQPTLTPSTAAARTISAPAPRTQGLRDEFLPRDPPPHLPAPRSARAPPGRSARSADGAGTGAAGHPPSLQTTHSHRKGEGGAPRLALPCDPPARPGVPLTVSPPSGRPRRGRRPPRFASKRGADPQLSALLRPAAQRDRATAAAAGPPPDGCPWLLQHQHTPFSRTCPGDPGTVFAMGFELVTGFPRSSSFRITQSPVVRTAPPRNHPCEETWLQNGSSLSGLGKGV